MGGLERLPDSAIALEDAAWPDGMFIGGGALSGGMIVASFVSVSESLFLAAAVLWITVILVSGVGRRIEHRRRPSERVGMGSRGIDNGRIVGSVEAWERDRVPASGRG